MKFIVTRTSGYSSDNISPCSESVAEQLDYIYVDERTVNTPTALPGGEAAWLARGINHRLDNGRIKRDIPMSEQVWFVELATLEELVAFMQKHGPLVVQQWHGDGRPELEIYDDYRE